MSWLVISRWIGGPLAVLPLATMLARLWKLQRRHRLWTSYGVSTRRPPSSGAGREPAEGHDGHEGNEGRCQRLHRAAGVHPVCTKSEGVLSSSHHAESILDLRCRRRR